MARSTALAFTFFSCSTVIPYRKGTTTLPRLIIDTIDIIDPSIDKEYKYAMSATVRNTEINGIDHRQVNGVAAPDVLGVRRRMKAMTVHIMMHW